MQGDVKDSIDIVIRSLSSQEKQVRHVKLRLSAYVATKSNLTRVEHAGYVCEYAALQVSLKCQINDFMTLAGDWEILKQNQTLWGI